MAEEVPAPAPNPALTLRQLSFTAELYPEMATMATEYIEKCESAGRLGKKRKTAKC